MGSITGTERISTVVIGGGQAGLVTGYHLARRGVPFLILDANERIGDAWRNRWDSLRLFTPAAFDGLDGMPFPAPRGSFPTKAEMADYLESYAARFSLPVRTGASVESVARDGGHYVVAGNDWRIEAEHVVVAMANYQEPRVPQAARDLDGGIVQLHSREYRNPSQLRAGDTLVVGAGNSGAEIAHEVASHGGNVWLSGKDVGQIPWRTDSAFARHVLSHIVFRVVFHRLLSTSTPIGRKVRSRGHTAPPLIRVKRHDLRGAGVRFVARFTGVRGGRPQLQDGQTLDVANVIWCTGFQEGFPWIDLPIFERNGLPRHDVGIVREEPGFYFVGLHFLRALSSAMVHGVSRDAEHVANVVAARVHRAPVAVARSRGKLARWSRSAARSDAIASYNTSAKAESASSIARRIRGSSATSP